MAGIAAHWFLLAAVGLAVAIAVIRGFAGRSGTSVGCFYVDLARSLYVLVPLAVVGGLLLVSQGVVQSLGGPHDAATIEGATQRLALGPVASQAAVKTMGSVGGATST